MGYESRWNPCIAHRGGEVDRFLAHYFAQADRSVFLVAGAGFDPRACAVPGRLGTTTKFVHALFIKEERPDPPHEQVARSAANTTALLAMLAKRQVESIDIFGSDGAVVGGRSIINVLRRQDLENVTDIVVDISALSVGTSFPIIRYFVEQIGRERDLPICTYLLRMTHNWTRTSAPSQMKHPVMCTVSRVAQRSLTCHTQHGCGCRNWLPDGVVHLRSSTTSSSPTTSAPSFPSQQTTLVVATCWRRSI